MNILFFDTETTGLVKDYKPATDPSQPMAVQIGMKLDEDTRLERGALNYMLRPEGWEVSREAAEITGISADVADAFGSSFVTGVEMFLDMVDNADVLIAHNARFDITVMRRMTQVYCDKVNIDYFDPFDGKALVCTMVATTPILRLPPKRKGEYKWPKLSECVKYFFNEELEGAHDALVDVRACARVFYHLIDEGHLTYD